MAVIGLRFQANGSPRDGALIINSWGNYVGGGKFPPDQPDGSFWASRPDLERILGQGDSYAIGSVDGFRFRDLHNGEWLAPGPIEHLSQAE
jgi:C1A family cysteine protease